MNKQVHPSEKWVFTLYIAGDTPANRLVNRRLATLLTDQLGDTYSLDVVDLELKPHLAEMDDIFAVPTLIRTSPSPKCKLIGDLSERQRVLAALHLE